jgi:hypothetical protein
MRWGSRMVVHVEAHMLDHVQYVSLDEGELLESPDQATIDSQDAARGTHVEGDLDMSVDRRGVGLAVAHVSALKDISNVLVLVQ